MKNFKRVDRVSNDWIVGNALLTATISAFKAVHKSLDAKLVELNQEINHAIDHVDKGAYLDRLEGLQSQMKNLHRNISLAMSELYLVFNELDEA